MKPYIMTWYGEVGPVPPASSSQAAVTTTVGAAVDDTAATSTTPFGYAEAQANAIVANVNALRVDVLALTTLVNQLRSDLVAMELIRGS